MLERSTSEPMSQQWDEENVSLHNETLSSLKSSASENSEKKRIQYNWSSNRQLLYYLSKTHLRMHREQFYKKLPCHKLTYKTVGFNYCDSVKNFSISKLYSLLYIAVLINYDKLVMADILRFIKEGHLSLNSYKHFFPEDYLNQSVRFGKFQRSQYFTNKPFRVVASRLIRYLNIPRYIAVPDFAELCDRYCKELNLPDAVSQCAKKLLLIGKQKLNLNYDAGILSTIIIVLKLLFGLDDRTEYLVGCESDMFDIIAWLKYLECRRLLLSEHHFPTQFHNDISMQQTSQFASFNCMKESPNQQLHKVSEKFQLLLGVLKNNLTRSKFQIAFPPSLTPSCDYIKVINKEKTVEKYYLEDIVSRSFAYDNLDFFMKRSNVEAGTQVVNSEPFYNLKLKSSNYKEKYVILRECQQKILVNLKYSQNLRDTSMKHTFNEKFNNLSNHNFQQKNEKHEACFCSYKNCWLQRRNCHSGKKLYMLANKLPLSLISHTIYDEYYGNMYKTANNNVKKETDNCQGFFIPYKTYWVESRSRCTSKAEFDMVVNELPRTFRIILNECACICEQTLRCFFDEFQSTEAYFLNCLGYNL